MASIHLPSTWNRLWAYSIDKTIMSLFLLPVVLAKVRLFLSGAPVFISLWTLVYIMLVPMIYEFLFLLFFQRTPGKWLFGLTVVPRFHADEPLHWTRCLLRALTSRLSIFFAIAPFALAFFKYDRTHLSDWVAETRVVQNKTRSERPRIRWVVGFLLITMYAWQGIGRAAVLVKHIDWAEKRVDVVGAFGFNEVFELRDKLQE